MFLPRISLSLSWPGVRCGLLSSTEILLFLPWQEDYRSLARSSFYNDFKRRKLGSQLRHVLVLSAADSRVRRKVGRRRWTGITCKPETESVSLLLPLMTPNES